MPFTLYSHTTLSLFLYLFQLLLVRMSAICNFLELRQMEMEDIVKPPPSEKLTLLSKLYVVDLAMYVLHGIVVGAGIVPVLMLVVDGMNLGMMGGVVHSLLVLFRMYEKEHGKGSAGGGEVGEMGGSNGKD
jgi:hypothetical protein